MVMFRTASKSFTSISWFNTLSISALEKGICFAAEIGLSGEVRPVTKLDQRLAEAEKLGYKKIFISKYSSIKPQDYKNIEVIKEGKIEDVFRLLFG